MAGAPEVTLREIALVFLRLGVTAFGGPLAHLSAMEDELVHRRRWLTRELFVDLAGITAVLPGPNSTELAMAIGQHRAGRTGLVVAGVAFILPSMLLVWLLAALYVSAHAARGGAGAGSAATWVALLPAVLAGMQPVVLAVVVQAAWRLGRTVLRARTALAVAILALGLALAGVNELLVLAVGALVSVLPLFPALAARAGLDGTPRWTLLPLGAALLPATTAGPSPSALLLLFLKIGSLLFGSGYVLFAFLRREFVERHAWLTDAQLLDAITIGQVTPGPLFTSATFVGYLVGGSPGAMVSTIGIFAPAFLLVGLSARIVEVVRARPVLRAALDGVNAASLALMAAAILHSARIVAGSGRTLLILLVAALVLIGTRAPASLLLAGGALLGALTLVP